MILDCYISFSPNYELYIRGEALVSICQNQPAISPNSNQNNKEVPTQNMSEKDESSEEKEEPTTISPKTVFKTKFLTNFPPTILPQEENEPTTISPTGVYETKIFSFHPVYLPQEENEPTAISPTGVYGTKISTSISPINPPQEENEPTTISQKTVSETKISTSFPLTNLPQKISDTESSIDDTSTPKTPKNNLKRISLFLNVISTVIFLIVIGIYGYVFKILKEITEKITLL